MKKGTEKITRKKITRVRLTVSQEYLFSSSVILSKLSLYLILSYSSKLFATTGVNTSILVFFIWLMTERLVFCRLRSIILVFLPAFYLSINVVVLLS